MRKRTDRRAADLNDRVARLATMFADRRAADLDALTEAIRKAGLEARRAADPAAPYQSDPDRLIAERLIAGGWHR